MSSLNGFNGQQPGRPPARPADQPQAQQAPANWQQPQQPQAAQWPQQGYAPAQGQAYGQQPAAGYGTLTANPDPYAPNFEPYAAAGQRAPQPAYQQAPSYQQQPANGQYYGQQGYGAPDPRGQPAAHWNGQAANARGFDVGSYLPQSAAAQTNAHYRADAEPSLSDWSNAHQQGGHGYELGDAHGSGQDMGFAQAAGGELEQGYSEEDADYDYEDTGRGRRPMMIAAALAGAILVGGGMAYGYKAFLGGGASGSPPMIKSASEPSKIKPADAGGKQFAHADSKIMGRLGDGAAAGAAADPAAASEVDANGTRKVSTLVVGRDGTIQPPAAPPSSSDVVPTASAPSSNNVNVPGMMVVDALGQKPKSADAAPAAAAPPQQKLVVTPPAAAPQKPITVAKAEPAKESADATGSIEPQAAAAPAPVAKKPVPKKVAAAAPTIANDASPAPASAGTNGYVAVLASVPMSASSRMDALKRFADMQQKYGNVLGGKTPDVAEANLGAKGSYHRLVVGPPASREQANAVCTQLKAQGYADCWVTSY